MKLDLYTISSVAAVLAFFLPLLVVVSKNLWRDSFFVLFAGFWAMGGAINIPDLFSILSPEVRSKMGAAYNMIDLPLIIFILYLTNNSEKVKRVVLGGLIIVLALELVGMFQHGITHDSLKYAMGLGIVLVMAVCGIEVVKYLQEIEHSKRQTAKVLVYAALLFEYGTFTVIYIFDYYLESAKRTDTYLIYYISTVIALLIASWGYVLSRSAPEEGSLDAHFLVGERTRRSTNR